MRALLLRKRFLMQLILPTNVSVEGTVSDVVRMSTVRLLSLVAFGLADATLPAHIRFRWSDLMGGGLPAEIESAGTLTNCGEAGSQDEGALRFDRELVLAMWKLAVDRGADVPRGGWTAAHALQLGRPLLRAEAAQYVLSAALCQPADFAAIATSLSLSWSDEAGAEEVFDAACLVPLAMLDLAIESPLTHTDAAVSSLRTLRACLEGEQSDHVLRDAVLQRKLIDGVRSLVARISSEGRGGAPSAYLRGWQRRLLIEVCSLLCTMTSPATPLSIPALDLLWELWGRCASGRQLPRQLRCLLLRLCGGGVVQASGLPYIGFFLDAVQGAGSGSYERTAACEAIAASGVLVTTTRRDDSNSDGNELDDAETLECLRVWGLTLALLSDEENAVRASAATHVSIALERVRPSSTPVAYCPPRSVAMVFAHLQRCYSPADAAAPVRSPVWPRWLIGVCLGDRHLAASVAKALPALEGNAVGGDAIRAGARVTDHAHSAQLRHWHPERIVRAAATALAAGRSDEVRAALVAAIGVCAASALADVTPLPASAAADAGVAALKVTVLGGPHEMHARGCAVLRRLRILREALL